MLYIDFLYGIYFNLIYNSKFDFIFYDVAISSQWQSTGHFYPIQIAQFGLSHWSRLELNSQNQPNDIYKFERIQPGKLIQHYFKKNVV